MEIGKIVLNSIEIGNIKTTDIQLNNNSIESIKCINYTVNHSDMYVHESDNLLPNIVEFIFNQDIINSDLNYYYTVLYITDDIRMPYNFTSGQPIRDIEKSESNEYIKNMLQTLLVGVQVNDFKCS